MRSRRTEKKKTIKRRFVSLPDTRNTERGERWLREIVGASEAMDEGKKKSMQEVLDEMKTPLLNQRSREPGDDDE